MITVIRKQIKSKYAQGILYGFFILVAILFVMPDMISQRVQGPDWIMDVNGVKISSATFSRSLIKQETNIHTIQTQYGPYAQMFLQMLGLNKDPRLTALDEVVRNELFDQLASRIPLYVQDEYVEQTLNVPHLAQQRGLFEFLPLGTITQEGVDTQFLRGYLARSQMNMQQFEHEVKQALARHIVQDLTGLAAYVPAYMVHSAIEREFAKRDYALLTFSREALRKEVSAKPITTEELTAFFEKESKNYWVPEMRAGVVWKFTPEQYGITVADDKIEEYYEKNRVTKYMQEPAQTEVRRILFKLSETEPKELLKKRAAEVHKELMSNPQAFAEKARAVSDDAQTASKGGLMAPFTKGSMDPVFERKAFMLKEDGQISEVFESKDGLEIIQRVSRKAPVFKPLSQVKQEIHDIVLKQQFVQQFGKEVKRIIDRTGINEEALEQFIKEKKSVSTPIEAAAKDDSKRMQLMFKLKKGDADFYTEGNVGYIVQVTDIKKRFLPALESIKDTVQRDYIDYMTQKLMHERIGAALQALKKEEPSAVAKQYGAKVQEVASIDPQNKERIKELQEKGLPLDSMLQIENKGAVGSMIAEDGYAFYVSHVEKPAQELYVEKEAATRTRLNQESKALLMQGFVDSLARNAKIETNEKLFTQIENQTV